MELAVILVVHRNSTEHGRQKLSSFMVLMYTQNRVTRCHCECTSDKMSKMRLSYCVATVHRVRSEDCVCVIFR